MVFKALPLLRLPCLVQLEILGNWNLTEQYRLAKLSKRSACVVKKITRIRQYSLTISFEDVPYFYLVRTDVAEKYDWENQNREKEFKLSPITTEEDVKQMQNTIILCADVFNKPILKLRMLKDGPTILAALKVAHELNLKIGHPLFALEDSNVEIYARLIHLFKNVPRLELDSVPPSGFPEQLYPSFHCNFVNIQRTQCRTSWFNVERLLNHFMDCKKVRISSYPYFEFPEMRPLLQKWIRGESRMETLIIVSSRQAIPYETLLAGIPAVRVHSARPKSPNKLFEEGYIVTMNNGKEAFVGEHLDCFVMTTDFQV